MAAFKTSVSFAVVEISHMPVHHLQGAYICTLAAFSNSPQLTERIAGAGGTSYLCITAQVGRELFLIPGTLGEG